MGALLASEPHESETRATEAEIATICGHLNVLHARLVAITEDALVTGSWGGHGVRSPEHWLAWQTGLSPARARQVVLLAKRRHELPVTMAAFALGELSIDQAAAVATHVRAGNDAEACGLAKNATVSQLANLLGRYRYEPTPRPEAPPAEAADRPVAEPDPPEAAPDASPDAESCACDDHGSPEAAPSTDPPRFAHGITGPTDDERITTALAPGRVWFGFDADGRFALHADLTADAGARIEAALREAKDRLFRAGHTEVTWSDALVDVANRSIEAASPSRQHRFRTYVHLDTEGAWLQAGPALPRALFDQLVCDGEVQPVWRTAGRPVSIGRASRVVPDHTRRQVLDRDRVCRTPGCTCRIGLEVHHVVQWTAGGPTDLGNLAALCADHHTRHHRGEFTIEGDADVPDGLVFRRRTGGVIQAHRPPAPPGGAVPPAPPPGHAYRHPTGERLDTSCVVFSEPARPTAAPPTRPASPHDPAWAAA